MDVQSEPVIHIDFKLDSKDVAYFRNRLSRSRKTRAQRDDHRVVLGAEALAVKAMESNPPSFVEHRIETLQTMISMVKDREWRLENEDRDRVMDALAYFSDPKDLIDDDIPGIGLLDDTIMIDLTAFDLAPELEAYADFCANREDLAAALQDAQPIDAAREALQARMRRRRRRRTGSGTPSADLITSLFHTG